MAHERPVADSSRVTATAGEPLEGPNGPGGSSAGDAGTVSVFLCDDVPELRALMREALKQGGAIRVVGEAGDGAAGIEGVAQLQPDVTVLDLSMPDMDGLEALPGISAAAPNTQVVVFSGFRADRMEPLALALGAVRYVEKGAPLDTLRQAVLEAARS